MDETWLRSRTPDGRWFRITFDKPPTITDIDHMIDVITVARKGYAERVVPREIKGVRVIRLATPEG